MTGRAPAEVAPLVAPPPHARSRPLSGAASAGYRVRVVDRTADLPAADWAKAREVAPSVFMDPRFLATVERAFAAQGRFHHAIVVDRHGRPERHPVDDAVGELELLRRRAVAAVGADHDPRVELPGVGCLPLSHLGARLGCLP